MSDLIVKMVNIDGIVPHGNADSLELAIIKGWQCVTSKGLYKKGDKCIYVPIDSIIPPYLISVLFANSKIKLTNGRIRAIKIRGQISEGLIINPKLVNLEHVPVGVDVARQLNITKYEPKEDSNFESSIGKARATAGNLNFTKYTDIQNIKHFNTAFNKGEPVVITEKLHGTNWRAGYVLKTPKNFLHRIAIWLGLTEKYEFAYGSHNKTLDNKDLDIVPAPNIYAEMVQKYDLRKIIPKGVIIYGEVFGAGVQKGYSYGLKGHDLAIFDVKKDGYYLGKLEALNYAKHVLRLPTVPVIYDGPYIDMSHLKELATGASTICVTQKIREGIVVASTYLPRKILKLISDDYSTNKNNTDFH